VRISGGAPRPTRTRRAAAGRSAYEALERLAAGTNGKGDGLIAGSRVLAPTGEKHLDNATGALAQFASTRAFPPKTFAPKKTEPVPITPTRGLSSDGTSNMAAFTGGGRANGGAHAKRENRTRVHT